jgi:heterodisulfide reductase subunit B
MKYLYYPGCSLEGTAMEYNIATRAFMEAMGAELIELKDWTCCGASAAESASQLLSLVLPALNLAIAEEMDETADILVPCSACYLNLKKVEEKTRKNPELLEKINTVLKEKNRRFRGRTRTRHLLDVISRDLGAEEIQSRTKNPLAGLRIAPYYGCQCLRPYPVFDDPEEPRSMDALIEAAGASVHHWNMGGKCCGAAHMNTKTDVAVQLVSSILREAKGADAVVTVCPMCQMNLEAYQKKVSSVSNETVNMTVLYLPQLLGLAAGLSENQVRLDLNLSVTQQFRDKLRRDVVLAEAA